MLHNIGAILSIITGIWIVVFLLINNPRKTVNIALALTNLSVIVFIVSHVIGTNTVDPHLSKMILMANISIIFVVIFTMHTTLAVLNIDKQRRALLGSVYIIGIALAVFYLIYPDTFLLDSIPKMYFPNYYNPGELHWIMRVIFDIAIPILLLYELLAVYRNSSNMIEKNRIKYWTATVIFGYIVGSIPILLVYDIPINPAWGIWFVPFYSIPLVYGAVTYSMVDVRIIAKKAFLYGLAVVVIGGFITLINIVNDVIQSVYPEFPFWIAPFTSAIILVGFGILVWKKLRESDILKYEFITTVTHKFRTPLTHIKWAAENLNNMSIPEEGKEQLKYIESSNTKLVELTNVLVNVADAESTAYQYHFAKTDISVLTQEVLDATESRSLTKTISWEKDLTPRIYVNCDERIKFVVQTLLENAIQYTPEKGKISISVKQVSDNMVFRVSDTGIGVSREELPLIFSKFYRTKKAKEADTEGMGVGLYISKSIVLRHHGKIWVESEGVDSGSTFVFTLPIGK
ncbi:MAG: HAMP domain-containing sensor histidine kinase [Candidatus Paceibacterota bacterium]